jgi:hypothetical protein
MHHLPLDDDELAEAKNLFPKDTDFRKLEPRITIDDHRFSEALDFNSAIFFKRDQIYKLPFQAKR